MIYTDGIHMITDGEIRELHDFAIGIGVKRCWFENKRGKNHPHYDIKPHQVTAAINAGAILVHSKEIVRILKSKE